MGTVLGLLTIHASAKRVLALMGDPNPGLLMHKTPDLVYAGYNQELLDMTVRGFRIYTLSFLLCGTGL